MLGMVAESKSKVEKSALIKITHKQTNKQTKEIMLEIFNSDVKPLNCT